MKLSELSQKPKLIKITIDKKIVERIIELCYFTENQI